MKLRYRKIAARAAAAIVVAALAAPSAWGVSWWGKRDTREGLVAMVRNRVLLWPKEGAAKPAALNDAFQIEDRIRTYADSGCRVLFMEDSFLNIGPGTEYELTRSRYDEITGARDVGFRLAAGKVRLAVGRLFGRGSASVETPTAVVGVKGTDVIVGFDKDRKRTLVLVLQGLVEVASQNPALAGVVKQVGAGQFAEVGAGADPIEPQPAPDSMIQENVEATDVPAEPERTAPEVTTAEATTVVEPPPTVVEVTSTDVDVALLDTATASASVAGGTSAPTASQTSNSTLDQPLPEVLPPPITSVPPDQCPGLCP